MQIIADNLQIMNPKVADALEQHDPAPIGHIVRCCLNTGADAIGYFHLGRALEVPKVR